MATIEGFHPTSGRMEQFISTSLIASLRDLEYRHEILNEAVYNGRTRHVIPTYDAFNTSLICHLGKMTFASIIYPDISLPQTRTSIMSNITPQPSRLPSTRRLLYHTVKAATISGAVGLCKSVFQSFDHQQPPFDTRIKEWARNITSVLSS